MTQGDPAGIGPEILAKLALAEPPSIEPASRLVLIAEHPALEAVRDTLPNLNWDRLRRLGGVPSRAELLALPSTAVALLDPVASPRQVILGAPGAADAAGAIAALDAGVELTRRGITDAVVTAPLSKSVVSRYHLPGFTGHTDYLAAGAGLERYGCDYLMAFLAPDLQVALLSTHLPLTAAIHHVTKDSVLEALRCLTRHAPGRIALAGLNPHAGEEGLMGSEEIHTLSPAVARARAEGIEVAGPESPDSLFARARSGAFDWVLALYHDQGLIAVKTAAFGLATNWTLGLPYLRTSVDHGTAFAIAGKGLADERPLAACVETTVRMLDGELPRRTMR